MANVEARVRIEELLVDFIHAPAISRPGESDREWSFRAIVAEITYENDANEVALFPVCV